MVYLGSHLVYLGSHLVYLASHLVYLGSHFLISVPSGPLSANRLSLPVALLFTDSARYIPNMVYSVYCWDVCYVPRLQRDARTLRACKVCGGAYSFHHGVCGGLSWGHEEAWMGACVAGYQRRRLMRKHTARQLRFVNMQLIMHLTT